MNNFKEKIERIVFDQKIKKEEISKMAGKTRQWLHNVSISGKIWVSDLEKISKIGKVPMSYWWADEEEYKVEEIKNSYGLSPGELIKQLSDDKDRLKQENDELKERLGIKKEGTSGL